MKAARVPHLPSSTAAMGYKDLKSKIMTRNRDYRCDILRAVNRPMISTMRRAYSQIKATMNKEPSSKVDAMGLSLAIRPDAPAFGITSEIAHRVAFL
jgi:hypothetical protein